MPRERREDRHRVGQGVADREGRDRGARMFAGVKGVLTTMNVSWWLKDFASSMDEETADSKELAALARRLDPSETSPAVIADTVAKYDAVVDALIALARAARAVERTADHSGALAAGEGLSEAFRAYSAAVLSRIATEKALSPSGEVSDGTAALEFVASSMRLPHTPRQMADAMHPEGRER